MSVLLGIDIGTSGTNAWPSTRRARPSPPPRETYPAYAPSRSGASKTRKTGGRPRSARSAT